MVRRNPYRACHSLSQLERSKTNPRGFMVLPPELRELVYKFVLRQPGGLIYLHGDWERKKDSVRAVVMDRPFYPSILLCNKAISREAAHLFYSCNAFVLACTFGWCTPDCAWERACRWLEVIGPINRGSLRDLRIQQDGLRQTWQSKNGSRTSKAFSSHCGHLSPTPFRRYRELTVNRPASPGPVDDIGPSVKSAFRLLRRARPKNLTITMECRSRLIPGVTRGPPWMSLDLPNLLEWFNRHLLGDQGVEIVWKVAVDKDSAPADLVDRIQAKGWVVLHTGHASTAMDHTEYKLKRMALPETLVASEPYEHGC